MDTAEVIKPEDCQLQEEQVEQWNKASTTAPTVEELPLGEKLSSQKLAEYFGWKDDDVRQARSFGSHSLP